MAKKKYHHGESFDNMIKKDTSAFANMPQNVIMKYYPMSPSFADYSLNDAMSGVDSQLKADKKSKKSKEKF